ncbi:MAG: hypothetical protein JSV98_04985 [candidate division WOR-3 bacterium]|nr:MAG: hypothetical protein JSV98_04985 [candidate division WOR-3 bacterium]
MKKLIWLLPLMALIVSCNGESDGENYFPLAVGNIWNYNIVYRMIMTTDTTQYTGTSTTEITRETILNSNIDVLEQVTTTLWDDTTMTDHVDTTYLLSDGDRMLIYNDLADTDPDTGLVFPFEQGSTWTVYADTTDTLTAEVLGQDDITVPAGTYSDCWDVRFTSLGQTQDNWFAEGVGIVRYHMITLTPAMTTELTKELVSSTIQ